MPRCQITKKLTRQDARLWSLISQHSLTAGKTWCTASSVSLSGMTTFSNFQTIPQTSLSFCLRCWNWALGIYALNCPKHLLLDLFSTCTELQHHTLTPSKTLGLLYHKLMAPQSLCLFVVWLESPRVASKRNDWSACIWFASKSSAALESA